MKNLFLQKIKKLLNFASAHVPQFAILFLISITLPFLWIPATKIWGGGDVGIPMYNPDLQLQIVKSAWWETHSTGTVNPVTYTAVPFYFVLDKLYKIGLTAPLAQKMLFFIILFFGSVSTYLISNHLALKKRLALFSGIFYIFNLMSLSVWHRGVHNGMLMLLLIPLSFLLLLKGTSRRSFLSILAILFVCFCFSYTFGALGFVFSILLLWFSYLAFLFLIKKEERRFIFLYAVLLMSGWVITNLWWIIHFIAASTTVFDSFGLVGIKNWTVDVLVGLRNQTRAEYVLRGMSWFNHYVTSDWGDIYGNLIFILISWLPILIIFSTTLIQRVRRNFAWQYFILLALLVILISKGANPPFGWLATHLYSSFPALGPLRNPYEKVGILLILPYSYLFSVGLNELLNFTSSQFGKKFSGLIGFFAVSFLLLLNWPLLSGKIFYIPEYNYVIDVPEYYSEANSWLKSHNTDKRILHLPLAPGESVDYDWNFTGGVPSQVLFSGSSMAYAIGSPSVDLRLKDLITLIHRGDSDNIQRALSSLNVGWIVVHNETNPLKRGLESLDVVNKWISSEQDFLNKRAEFGPLTIWKVDINDSNHIEVANQYLKLVLPQQTNDLSSLWNLHNETDSQFFTIANSSNSSVKDLGGVSRISLTYPTRVVNYQVSKYKDLQGAVDSLPYVRFAPDSKYYKLVRIKELVENTLSTGKPFNKNLEKASKRLIETRMASLSSNANVAKNTLHEYSKVLQLCQDFVDRGEIVPESLSSDEKAFVDARLRDNYVVLQDIIAHIGGSEFTNEATNKLRSLFDSFSLAFGSGMEIKDGTNVITYEFEVDEAGEYILSLPYNGNDLPNLLSVDSAKIIPPASKGSNGNQLIYKPVKLDTGKHLITIEFPTPNIFDTQGSGSGSEIVIKSTNITEGKFDIKLDSVSTLWKYTLEFDYLISKGSSPIVRFTQDTDYVDAKGRKVPLVNKSLVKDEYVRTWVSSGTTYTPTSNANNAIIEIALLPWNDCERYLRKKYCTSESVLQKYGHESEVLIKNIVIKRVYAGLPTLNKNVDGFKLGTAGVDYQKIDGSNYILKISDQNPPYVITFSETFHPGWKLMDNNGTPIDAVTHFEVNGYANGWVVKEKLPEKVTLKFVLSGYTSTAIRDSLLGTVVFAFMLFVVKITYDKKKFK